jgi:putative endonuclease
MPYYVYITTNKPRGVLYIGVTNDISRRTYEHKDGLIKGFTKKYNLKKLVYVESYDQVDEAIKREKRLKNWHREWKINQIESVNPEWTELNTAL